MQRVALFVDGANMFYAQRDNHWHIDWRLAYHYFTDNKEKAAAYYFTATPHAGDPEKITNEQETGLEQLVRTGGGLFVIAGRNHGLDALLTVRSAKFGAMLPVEIDRNKHPDYKQVFAKPFKWTYSGRPLQT